ncbi:hypothetical protein [Chryseobacterium oranimense]|uniref:hypothetical protein n=1 Tax=Chryseobacterium oranimense TaxID=421058 RepID=UPI0022368934|nr:hypothetical protein [Chryseobacterium oranimense]
MKVLRKLNDLDKKKCNPIIFFSFEKNTNTRMFQKVISLEKNKKEFYFLLLYKALLLLILFYSVYKLYLKSKLSLQEWTVSDWLINYEDGGFKRRGIGGQLLFFLQDITHFSLPFIVFLLQALFYGFIYYFFIKLISQKKIDWNILLILISPLCLSYICINVGYSGRKEIILFALMGYLATGGVSRLKSIFVIAGYCIGLFFHEMFIFYLPLVISIFYLKTKKINSLEVYTLIILSFIIIAVIYYFGGEVNQGKSIEILKNRGVEFAYFNIFNYDKIEDPTFIGRVYISFSLFIAELFFVIFQLGYYVYKFHKKYFKYFLFINILSLIFVAPLFYLGVDWFRWINIYCVLLSLTVLLMLPDRKKTEELFNHNATIKSFILIAPVFFILFFIHIQYDASGSSLHGTIMYFKTKFDYLMGH